MLVYQSVGVIPYVRIGVKIVKSKLDSHITTRHLEAAKKRTPPKPQGMIERLYLAILLVTFLGMVKRMLSDPLLNGGEVK